MAYITQAPFWNTRTCLEYAASEMSWLTRNCLVWAKGDREFEQTVATDLMESKLARCYRVEANSEGINYDFGICTPRRCSQGNIVEHLDTFLDLVKLTLHRVIVPDFVYVSEVLPWQVLAEDRIDFVIGGFPNCGTSTLARTLAAHPEVSLLADELDVPMLEDPGIDQGNEWSNDWRSWLCADLLPRAWVDGKLPKKGTDAGGIPKVQGFKNPLLLYGEGCRQRLSRPLPKLLIAVRDPVEWLLSILGHNRTVMGFGLHDYVAPSIAGPAHGGWLGRDHGQFGSLLAALLDVWPSDRVLVVELEFLRNPATAPIALDAVARFLGIAPFSELPSQGGRLGVRYGRGLGVSSPSWGPEKLCAADSALQIRSMADHYEGEYEKLRNVLARAGVQELGVSRSIVLSGVYARHCLKDVPLPGARSLALGEAEQVAIERRLRLAWRGELGFRFRSRGSLRIAAIGCGAGDGPLRSEVRVTLWDSETQKPLIIATMGPDSPRWNGFAYGDVIHPAFTLHPDRLYDITAQVAPGTGPVPSGHAGIGIAPEIGTFVAGVFSKGPWLYPSEHDEYGWEEAYLSLLSLQVLEDVVLQQEDAA